MISFIGLVEIEQHDDQHFFLCLYEQYKRLMFSTAKKYISDSNVAEDLVQDSVVKLIQKIPTMRKLSKWAVCSYIVSTVRNTAINHLRRQQVAKNHHVDREYDEDVDAEHQCYLPTPEDLLIIDECRGEFQMAFNRLSSKDRDVLIGKYVLGLTDKELAEMHGCKPSSIRMVLTRARRSAIVEINKEAQSDDETR